MSITQKLGRIPLIQGTLEALQDLLFPPYCLGCQRRLDHSRPPLLCADCCQALSFITPPYCLGCGLPFAGGSSHLCGLCLQHHYAFDRACSALAYTPPVSSLLLALKFSGQTTVVATLAALVRESGACTLLHPPDLILPVPLHRLRLRERGFNQAMLLSRHCFPQWRNRIAPELLQRVRATRPQSQLSGRQRRSNLKGSFQLKSSSALRGKHLLLVDDVFTSGSTVNECAKTLRRAKPAAIEVFTLSRSLDKGQS
ncbi:ComF family protein [Desulfogranum mediterraneum]|uniref:ComF family protein n=1 Tax=Desulfogranum mediterraneum TaxID=160661 RepID=UPI00041FF684|nr:ComF family protein [Desulfogranum mediterraneum]